VELGVLGGSVSRLFFYISSFFFTWMGRVPFEDKTNDEPTFSDKTKRLSDRETLMAYLVNVHSNTKDFNLKYDVGLCIEILQGKENMHVSNLKSIVKELVSENEDLVSERDNLRMKLFHSSP